MYNDNKLEERKNKFQKVDMQILEARQNHKLSLRKKKIEEIIFKKRESTIEKSERKEYEIDPSMLNIEEHQDKHFSTGSEMYSWIKSLLTNEGKTLDEVKFCIFLLRKQTCVDQLDCNFIVKENQLLITLGSILEEFIDNKTIVNEIIWILTNTTSSENSEVLNTLTSEKFLNLYLRVFELYPNYIVREALVILFGNLSSSGAVYRDKLVHHSFFDKVCELLNFDKIHESFLRSALWFVSMVTKYLPTEERTMLKVCELSVHFLKVEDEELRTNCLWALSRLTELDNSSLVECVLGSGVCEYVFTIQDKKYIVPTVRMFGNLLSCQKEVVDYLMDLGVIPFLQKFLYHKLSINKRETLWAFSNATAGTPSQIKQVITSGVMANALHLVKDPDRDVAREAVYMVGNAVAGGDSEVLSMLKDHKFLDFFLGLLDQCRDTELLVMALNTIKVYLEKGECDRMHLDSNSSDDGYVNSHANYFESRNGLTVLENLQFFKVDYVFSLSSYLLEKFFKNKVKAEYWSQNN